MRLVFTIVLFNYILIFNSFAQDLLQDINGDEIVSVAGFGDSIAFGMGDLHQPGEFIDDPDVTNGSFGFLKRVRDLAGLPTDNLAEPGEFFTNDGILRFPGAVASTSADIIAFLEGTNDTGVGVSSSEYRKQLQKAVNIADVQGKRMVLFTLLPPCCSRLARVPFTRDFSARIREIAAWNEVPLADIEMAWDTTCDDLASCFLYNIPDGLHPNVRGHDVIGEVFLATLYGINIFESDGPRKLEETLDLEEGTVVVKAIPSAGDSGESE